MSPASVRLLSCRDTSNTASTTTPRACASGPLTYVYVNIGKTPHGSDTMLQNMMHIFCFSNTVLPISPGRKAGEREAIRLDLLKRHMYVGPTATHDPYHQVHTPRR
jgi:hypothetical protein